MKAGTFFSHLFPVALSIRSLPVCLHELFNAPVVGFFHILGKKTSRDFSLRAVIGYAFAADTSFSARCVGAGAVL